MSSEDLEFRQAAELLLQHHLSVHDRAIEASEREHGESEASGQLARGLLVNAWSTSLEEHCERTLSDLLSLMKTFDASSPEWTHHLFDDHVDRVGAQVTGKLPRSGEQRKILNLVSTVKTRAREELARVTEILAKLREAAESAEGPPSGALDGLLPLNQRAVLERDIVQMVKDATQAEPLSLLMIDLDHFKQVNDVHGHQAGDQVLIGVADILVACLSRKGKAYRYGGEELTVLLPNYTVEEAAGFGERVRQNIEAAVLGKKALEVTASLGLATAPLHADTAESLLERADAALYQAKHGGRNRLCVSG